MLPTNRLVIAFVRGAGTGVLITWIPVPAKTASNVAENVAVAVADEEPEASTRVVEVHREVACLLG